MRLRSAFFSFLYFGILAFAHNVKAQTPVMWSESIPDFRPLNITATASAFWICGVAEGIARSTDGKVWETKHHADQGGSLLLGIAFTSDEFGFAYGTAGTLLVTEDGGLTWNKEAIGADTILQASLSNATHGVLRTESSLLYLNGDTSPHPIMQPADVLKRFAFPEVLVSLNSQKMGIHLSEGPFSESGFLTTVDGGKSWAFYDPPSSGIKSFIGVNGKYWAVGHEVVDKDKPGGGHSIPLAISSEDGRVWQHSTHEMEPCHWQSCGLCTLSGCLASSGLLVDFFGSPTTYLGIPEGSLTAKWASVKSRVCSIGTSLRCASLGEPRDLKAPGEPMPAEQPVGPLRERSSSSGLHCLSCGLEPVYVDTKVAGRFTVHLSLLIRSDGTIESVEAKDAPSDAVRQRLKTQITQWLFEPFFREGRSVKVSTQPAISINVVRSR